MNILQLLEDLVQPQSSEQKYRGTFRRALSDPFKTPNRLGQGQFSTVTADKDPHLVKKFNHKPMNPITSTVGSLDHGRDGFTTYIDYLIKHRLMDNVHFPKVYENKKITDRKNQYISKYRMEKLIPGSKLTSDELDVILERDFGRNPDVYNTMDADNDEESVHWGKLKMIAATLKRVITRAKFDEIKNDDLKQALMIIREIKRGDQSLDLDLHSNNFMFRRTPYGPQLVITDPLVHINT